MDGLCEFQMKMSFIGIVKMIFGSTNSLGGYVEELLKELVQE